MFFSNYELIFYVIASLQEAISLPNWGLLRSHGLDTPEEHGYSTSGRSQ